MTTDEDFADTLEAAYWRFDALAKGHDPQRRAAGLGPMSERDAFKQVVRGISALLTSSHYRRPLEELARAADTAELFVRKTAPGEADYLRSKVMQAKAALS